MVKKDTKKSKNESIDRDGFGPSTKITPPLHKIIRVHLLQVKREEFANTLYYKMGYSKSM